MWTSARELLQNIEIKAWAWGPCGEKPSPRILADEPKLDLQECFGRTSSCTSLSEEHWVWCLQVLQHLQLATIPCGKKHVHLLEGQGALNLGQGGCLPVISRPTPAALRWFQLRARHGDAEILGLLQTSVLVDCVTAGRGSR